jgi:hypothetical protein
MPLVSIPKPEIPLKTFIVEIQRTIPIPAGPMKIAQFCPHENAQQRHFYFRNLLLVT